MNLNRRVSILVLIGAMSFVMACAAQSGFEETSVVQPGSNKEDSAMIQVDSITGETIRCRKIRKTGTRMSEQVCKSVTQWEQESAEDRDVLRQVQRDANIQTSSGER